MFWCIMNNFVGIKLTYMYICELIFGLLLHIWISVWLAEHTVFSGSLCML